MNDVNLEDTRRWADRIVHETPLGIVSDEQTNAALLKQSIPKGFYHVESGAPAPVEATHVILTAAAYEEEITGRGRLRLWMEFIYRNCTSPEAREYAGEALVGNHVPEGFTWEDENDRKP